MQEQRSTRHFFVILITASSFMLAACNKQTDSVASSLDDIQTILKTNNTNNEVHYQLSYDVDFPCSAKLQENWQQSEYNWQHIYRFDLSNIASNTFIQSKSGRRAITYGGYKEAQNGDRKTFTDKRINNMRYRANLSNEKQLLIIDAMNKAIALCEEKYSFE